MSSGSNSSSSEEVTFLSMAWIDESTPYHNNRATYIQDKTKWENIIPLYAKWSASVEAPFDSGYNGIEYLKYPTETYPDDIYFANINRLPSAVSLKNTFDNLMADFRSQPPLAITEPDKIILAVDNSGSMNTNTIQPAYNSLVDYIQTNYPNVELVQVEWRSEDYLDIWVQNLMTYVPPIDFPSSSSSSDSSSSESSSSDDCPDIGPNTLFFFNGQWHEIGLTADQLDALYGANNPSASNPFITMRDIDSSSSSSSESSSSSSDSSDSSESSSSSSAT